jgi:hypothetical protein
MMDSLARDVAGESVVYKSSGASWGRKWAPGRYVIVILVWFDDIVV